MKHVAKQGEDIAWIAQKYGRRNWKAIYEHADNDALREARPDPHVLQEGDEVIIPPVEPKTHEVETGGEYTFVLPVPKLKVRMFLQDHLGVPYDSKKYRLTVGNDEYEGQTDTDGLVDVEVAATAKQGELFLITSPPSAAAEVGHKYELMLAHLDPPQTITGARARLANLGFDTGGSGSEIDDRLRSALRTFQIQNELECSDIADDATELDEQTADALRTAHGN